MQTNILQENWKELLETIHLETNVSRLQDECFSLRQMHLELVRRGIPQTWFYAIEAEQDSQD